MASICVFCGSRAGTDAEYAAAASEFGRALALRDHTLIYGGGSVGMMGMLADSAMAAGGRVIGVIPEHLAKVEIMHARVTDMRITTDMHQRKATMHRLADAYVALPGGFGTLEEMFEALTWAQLELHARPIAILNTGGFYDGLLQLIRTMADKQFLSPSCASLVHVFGTVTQLVAWVDLRCPAAVTEP